MIESLYLFFIYCLYLSGSFVLGYVFTNKLLPKLDNQPLRLVFAFAFGNMAYSLLFHYLGMVHLLYEPILIFIFVAPTLWQLAHWQLNITKTNVVKNVKGLVSSLIPDRVSLATLTLIGFIVFPLLPQLLLLPVSWDGTAYHLALPKVFLQDHQLSFYQWFPQTTYPVGIISLYGYAQSLGEDRLSNFISFSFIPFLFYALTVGLRKKFSQPVVVLTAVLALFRPLLYSESAVTTFIDYPFALYGLLAGISLLYYLQTKKGEWLSALLILISFSALIKFTGLFFITAAGGVLLLATFYKDINLKKDIVALLRSSWQRGLLIFSLVPTVFWYFRNFLSTNNPVHPYFNNVFKGFDYDPATYVSITSDVKQINYFMLNTLNIFRAGKDTPQDYVNLSEIFFIATITIFSVITFFMMKKKEFRYVYLFSLLVFAPIVFFIGPLYRYYLPIIPILSLGISYAFVQFFDRWRWWYTLPALLFLASLVVQVDAVFYARNLMFLSTPKRQYLTYLKNYPYLQARLSVQDNWDVISYANEHLDPSKNKIVFVFDNRIYYFDAPTQFMHPSKFGYFTNPNLESVDMIVDVMKADGITHIAISENWGRHANLQTELYEEFVQTRLIPLYSSRKVTLYQLK